MGRAVWGSSRELRIPNKYPGRKGWATFLVSVKGKVGLVSVFNI